VPANTEVVVYLKSPNVADDDVDVTGYLYDAHLHFALGYAVWPHAGAQVKDVTGETITISDKVSEGTTIGVRTITDDGEGNQTVDAPVLPD
jgi:hypothetical protein